MPDSSNLTCCGVCATRLVKNGRTAAGTQRWRCPSCGASAVRKRPDLSRRHDLDLFVGWMLGKASQSEIDGTATGRSFRRRIRWCWDIVPVLPATGEVFDEVQLDGFNLRTGWTLLIASVDGKPVAYQWAGSENQAAWSALLTQLPAPTVVISDGASGLKGALAEHWPDTRIQRCLVHVQRNVRRYVTSRARTPAGKGLWGLALKLTRVKDRDAMDAWLLLLSQWEAEFLHLTKQRTYASSGALRPAWARPGQTWWFTHQRLRSGHQVLQRLIKAGHLFTFLDPALDEITIASTTNKIEGAINSPLRDLLRRHRGLSEHHQKRALEWWLYTHCPATGTPAVVLHNTANDPINKDEIDEIDKPVLYGTALTAEEGLWSRSGRTRGR
mgnify:CR=1 FL=1